MRVTKITYLFLYYKSHDIKCIKQKFFKIIEHFFDQNENKKSNY